MATSSLRKGSAKYILLQKCLTRQTVLNSDSFLTLSLWDRLIRRSIHTTSKRTLRTSSILFSTNESESLNVFENQPKSWLFVSDAVGGAYGAQVNLNLDLKTKLAGEQLQKLLLNVRVRKKNFDVDQLVKDFSYLQELEAKKKELEDRRDEFVNQISELKSQEKTEDVETRIKSLIKSLKEIKPERNNLMHQFWPVEEKVTLAALRLPNDLHHSTPLEEEYVILKEHVCHRDGSCNRESHVNIGKKYGLIKFSNVGPKAYYLRGELALSEISLSNSLCDSVQQHGFKLMAGPEFFKTPILEGCGRDIHDTTEVLTMQHIPYIVEPMNHLAGVSPMSFVAYVARTCIGDNIMPFRMMNCGRAYQDSDLPGLFGAAQSTQVGVFSCVRESEIEKEFDAVFNMIWNHIEALGFSIRACEIGASKLRHEEKRRVDIQMYSPSLDQYIPVAHVSDLGDYVSRRLMVSHNLNHADYKQGQPVHMVSGTLLNITSFLAIWMEHSDSTKDVFSLCSVKEPSQD